MSEPREVWLTTARINAAPGEGLPDVRPHAWMDEALCGQLGPNDAVWYPDAGGDHRTSKRICRDCPVSAPCLDYALNTDERHGIWAGTNERTRRRLRREGAA